ncbi:DUF3050 domain-containing protein [Bizionia paragorgiae]|jgi:hypothetical protein|uniref:DUF3050 domain-containing protein n=1 Tax=Bizionia paragorgiae TaxID=283786 RepID=UPI00299EF668|nr:DUF3050 domain-containing protein [Bizionia paragorgiae]MDX1270638.1 DUF3050 domain-containing protein [Bizionia paragorgiae]
MNHIAHIEAELAPLKTQLKEHKLYKNLNSIEDIKIFMEQHVYAVWDFMSLLKALQIHLTTVTLPWVPVSNPTISQFINEIVLGEESDVNAHNVPQSHYEMYLDAMHQINANTTPVTQLVTYIQNGDSLSTALDKIEIHKDTKAFVTHTFEVINTNEIHKIASDFTFGREDLIPDMFLQIISESEKDSSPSPYSKLSYYLHRHIEVDGDNHGPLSIKMISELCGDDTKKWEDVLLTAKASLRSRLLLWDTINNLILERKNKLA